jgi:DNA replication and repair protein RecF
MFLKGVSLQHFRSATQRTVTFSLPTTVIVAANAKGKTTLLEAIALLSTGESFRATEVEEMIAFNQPLARVKGRIEGNVLTRDGLTEGDLGSGELGSEDADEVTELEVVLTRGELDGKRVQSRLFSVNNVRRRRRDFAGKFFTVVFRPEDMRLIEGSPSRRREYLNTMLSVSDPQYAIVCYNKFKKVRRLAPR